MFRRPAKPFKPTVLRLSELSNANPSLLFSELVPIKQSEQGLQEDLPKYKGETNFIYAMLVKSQTETRMPQKLS